MIKGARTPLQFAPQGTLALAEDEELVGCHVAQVVNVRATDESGTLRGEYWWRTEMGSAIELALHHPADVMEDIAAHLVDEGLSRWVQDAAFVGVQVVRTARLRHRTSIVWTLRRGRRAAQTTSTELVR
jgi:hypothetical protein